VLPDAMVVLPRIIGNPELPPLTVFNMITSHRLELYKHLLYLMLLCL
jgi:hypothetical protein